MKIIYIALLSSLLSFALSSQAIDGAFAFDTDPAKKYSIYVPSSYDDAIPNSMMLGFHPLNTSRWDAKSWRDTLIVFAEDNGLLLVCPDGGPDGRVDDSIDTSFTTVLLDSMNVWYNIDQDEKYIMGFSWGGKTTYSYGLRRTSQFQGYLIIGAAITLNEVVDVMPNATDEAFYLVHGSNDTPSTRYEPLLAALDGVQACTNSILMQGVGHTIDFPNRNEILNDAYNWLKETNCESSSTTTIENKVTIYPNPTTHNVTIEGIAINEENLIVTDLWGRAISYEVNQNSILLDADFGGTVLITILSNNKPLIKKIVKL